MKELIKLDDLKPIDLYMGDGLKGVIEEIRQKVLIVGLDVANKKDRDFMRSSAANIAKAKTKLDDMGKELTEEWKAKAKAVDVTRKGMRETLDELKKEVREPLTAYENIEKERKARIEQTYDTIVKLGFAYLPETMEPLALGELEENLQKLNAMVIDESLGELELACMKSMKKSKERLENKIIEIKQALANAAELERLRLAEEEQQREEREAQIAEDAAANAREEAAKILLQQQQEAKKREEDAIKEAEEAKQKLADQKKQAKLQEEQAVKREQLRQEEEARKAEKEAEEREANKAHKRKINNAAMKSFIDGGMDKDSAKLAVQLLAQRVIENCQINY